MTAKKEKSSGGISFFEKYLTVWVALCIATGILLGKLFPGMADQLRKLEWAGISLPITILIWVMIFPMMLKVDFGSIRRSLVSPKGLTVTLVTNWLIKPFTMYLLSILFFKLVFGRWIEGAVSDQYIAGAVLLGAAPCTAMVFVWSHLTKGDSGYTLVQVALNDLIILIAYVPITGLLLGISNITIPWMTLFLSVLLFVIIPLTAAVIVRRTVIRTRGESWLNGKLLPRLSTATIPGLLLTLILIFVFQGDKILNQPLDIAMIAVPLSIQTVLIFAIAFIWAKLWGIKQEIAAPAALIGASNFFELAVAVAIALFGLDSGATLATVVGVLVEVPLMLSLVAVANRFANTGKKLKIEEKKA